MPSPGFWAQTSNVDWCEENYVYSPYIAEFFNTISNIPLFCLSVLGICQCRKQGYGLRFQLGYWTLLIIALGSAAFHGTLTRAGQAADEVPMVLATSVFLYQILERGRSEVNRTLAGFLLVYVTAFALVYVLLPQYFGFFLAAYIFGVLTIYYLSIRHVMAERSLGRSPESRIKTTLCKWSIGTYTFGFLVWNIENRFCDYLRAVIFPYTGSWHAWFHLCSAVGPYSWTLFSLYSHQLALNRRVKLATLASSCGGALAVPVVVVVQKAS